MLTIAVDFDGTIVEHEYPRIGAPIPFAIDVLKRLQGEGHTLILWTLREGKLLQEAIDYCAKQGLEFYAHNENYPDERLEPNIPRKLSVDIFIDDRNVGGLLDWGIVYKTIQSGENYISSMDRISDDRPKRKRNWMIRFGEAWEKARGRNY